MNLPSPHFSRDALNLPFQADDCTFQTVWLKCLERNMREPCPKVITDLRREGSLTGRADAPSLKIRLPGPSKRSQERRRHMRVTNADLEQNHSLLNRMCPNHDSDGWTYGQPLLEREEGNRSRNKSTRPTGQLPPVRIPNNSAHHPIETTHYAITVPVQSRHTPEGRRSSA